ncbi:PREDICTED: ankyrin repeat domain-containing protein 50 [Condylura cristata]|uniref:ankyrin repeat domain-containing protein 50 n=1 Tax=Condylura cristata TaxID=143302 RepID=UPI0006433BF2|nr:PREDICTED: ankyrin repeat domain-containing protein 50 [Condylura cristata]
MSGPAVWRSLEDRPAAGRPAASDTATETLLSAVAAAVSTAGRLEPPGRARRRERPFREAHGPSAGFRKVSLDDLRRAHVVKDVQRYILQRLDREEALRRHLTKETAEMLNQLHIKSGGCFLFLERVLDGVAEGGVLLREVRDIPGTLNGLYLWLCQRLFVRKQFARVQPILNVVLAARRPLTVTELYHAVWTRSMALTVDDFQRKLDVLSKLLVDGRGGTKTLFHHSFAEWLLDVKHCTQKYLCSAAEGHRMLAMSHSCRAPRLSALEAQDFALHLARSNLTPLLAAASMGHAAVVNALLFWGAAVDSIDGEGRTVLSIAAAQGNVEVVRTLLDRGLDENHRDDAGWTPLHMAAFEGHRPICEALLEQGARANEMDNDGRIPSILAAQEGHYGCLQVLLEAKASVDHRGYDGRNALRVAALEGHRDVVELLLSHGADVDCRDADGRPTLYILALENQLAMAECLLENGADVEASDAEGRTALHVSCWQGHLEVVRALAKLRVLSRELDARPGGRRGRALRAGGAGLYTTAVLPVLSQTGAPGVR